MEYQKINTLFKRDANNIIIPSEFTLQEFGYLKDVPWECTEKVDGTNMRVEIAKTGGNFSVEYKGRTERANIPTHLYNKMRALFDKVKWESIFPQLTEPEDLTITLYGEGYGYKIQKGSNYISDDVNFILFDVKIGKWWLNRASIEEIALSLGIPVVPLIGYMTIPKAIEFVKKGFKSTFSENRDYDAEGLVLKTPVGLLSRKGERIITKIKTEDFRKYVAKYGDNWDIEQPSNEKYEK